MNSDGKNVWFYITLLILFFLEKNARTYIICMLYASLK